MLASDLLLSSVLCPALCFPLTCAAAAAPVLQVSLPTQYNNRNQDPVGALSSALARLQANRPLRELREVAKGITKQLPQPIQVRLVRCFGDTVLSVWYAVCSRVGMLVCKGWNMSAACRHLAAGTQWHVSCPAAVSTGIGSRHDMHAAAVLQT